MKCHHYVTTRAVNRPHIAPRWLRTREALLDVVAYPKGGDARQRARGGLIQCADTLPDPAGWPVHCALTGQRPARPERTGHAPAAKRWPTGRPFGTDRANGRMGGGRARVRGPTPADFTAKTWYMMAEQLTCHIVGHGALH